MRSIPLLTVTSTSFAGSMPGSSARTTRASPSRNSSTFIASSVENAVSNHRERLGQVTVGHVSTGATASLGAFFSALSAFLFFLFMIHTSTSMVRPRGAPTPGAKVPSGLGRRDVGDEAADGRQRGVVALGDVDPGRLVERGHQVQEVHRVEVDLVLQQRVVVDLVEVDLGSDAVQQLTEQRLGRRLAVTGPPGR